MNRNCEYRCSMSKNRINSEMKRIKKKDHEQWTHTNNINTTQHSSHFVRSLGSQTMLILFLASSSRARGKLFLFQIWCVAGVCLFIATTAVRVRVFFHEMSNFVIYQCCWLALLYPSIVQHQPFVVGDTAMSEIFCLENPNSQWFVLPFFCSFYNFFLDATWFFDVLHFIML